MNRHEQSHYTDNDGLFQWIKDTAMGRNRKKQNPDTITAISEIFNDPTSPAHRIFSSMATNHPYSLIEMMWLVTHDNELVEHPKPLPIPEYEREEFYEALFKLRQTGLVIKLEIKPPTESTGSEYKYMRPGAESPYFDYPQGRFPRPVSLDEILDIHYLDTDEPDGLDD